MPIAPQTFHLMIAPDRCLSVTAIAIAQAIAAARDAMEFLQRTGDAIAVAGRRVEEDEYLLTCLLCPATHPEHEGESPLIALQEHLMAEHGLPVEALRSAVCVCERQGGQEIFVWVLPEAAARILGLSQSSFMRAVTVYQGTPKRSQSEQPSAEELDGWNTMGFTRPFVGREARQDAYLIKEDVCAWYGYRCGDMGLNTLIVWPKGEWEIIR